LPPTSTIEDRMIASLDDEQRQQLSDRLRHASSRSTNLGCPSAH
jgi:hypothetical protein